MMKSIFHFIVVCMCAVQEITVDGGKIAGDLIKPVGDGGVHQVRVVMG